jgi:hypothetical protein
MKRALFALLLAAAPAVAEVSLIIPGAPPQAELDDSPLGLFRKDLKMERDAWVNMLREVKGSTVKQLKQHPDANCMADVERKLQIEGFEILELSALQIQLTQNPNKDELIRQIVDALQGYIDRKYAVRVLPSLIITCTPNPRLKPEERKRGLVEFLSGVADGELGEVNAYLVREFEKPVGFVCVQMHLAERANLDSMIRLIELSFGAMLNNHTKAMNEQFEQNFGAPAEKLFRDMPKQPEYLWGK